jgi:uncharacterized FlaG/YvyC family protein
MDVFRTTFGAPSRMLRKLTGGLLGKLIDVDDSKPSTEAEHGGLSGIARSAAEAEAKDAQERERREKRRSMLARLLDLPSGTQVDIVVDASVQELTFVVRDRATGRNLRTVPEAEAKALIEQFQRHHGAFIDRSF